MKELTHNPLSRHALTLQELRALRDVDVTLCRVEMTHSLRLIVKSLTTVRLVGLQQMKHTALPGVMVRDKLPHIPVWRRGGLRRFWVYALDDLGVIPRNWLYPSAAWLQPLCLILARSADAFSAEFPKLDPRDL